MHTETQPAQDLRLKAQETATTVVEEAQHVVETKASSQKDRAADTMEAVARTLRDAGSGLREEQPQIASFADEAATRMAGISTYVREHEVRDLVGEAEQFARREPLIFLGSAFAIGFLAARFLKAAAPGSAGGFTGNQGRNGGYARTGFEGAYGSGTEFNGRDYGAAYGSPGAVAGTFDSGNDLASKSQEADTGSHIDRGGDSDWIDEGGARTDAAEDAERRDQ